jgi:hypothetical protein
MARVDEVESRPEPFGGGGAPKWMVYNGKNN